MPATATTVDPRVARSRERIVVAAMEELVERGYAGMTIEGVATRAGVGKATIYRHYPQRADLVGAVLEAYRSSHDTPDTGDLLRDVEEILVDLVERSNVPEARLYTVLVDAAERDPVVAEHRHEWVQERRRPLVEALQAGIARGELPPSTDLELVTDMLTAPLFLRRFVTRVPLTAEYARRVARSVLRPWCDLPAAAGPDDAAS